MGMHDDYGKEVLARATSNTCVVLGDAVETRYSVGGACRIDGAIGDIAIEIESRTGKQVRGAVLDLISHRFPKKLLILLPAYMDVEIEQIRCNEIFRRFCQPESYRVIVLKGKGGVFRFEEDVAIVADALKQLGLEYPQI